jgi:hypothetical protein
VIEADDDVVVHSETRPTRGASAACSRSRAHEPDGTAHAQERRVDAAEAPPVRVWLLTPAAVSSREQLA